ncbi:glutamate cyclase domain-containing protein [Achromobacter aloeverae]
MNKALAVAALDRRLDLLSNIDVGGRGVEALLEASRAALSGASPVGAAADLLAGLPRGATVLYTTGSVSRAWISPRVGENDGPAGTAALARALTLGLGTHNVVVCEETLVDGLAAIFTTAGFSVLSFDEAKKASQDGSLATVSFEPFTVNTQDAAREAEALLARVEPDLLISAERVGRARDGVYYSMRAIDYGQGRARIDHIFDLANARGIPTLCVGDGGNEIGMGLIADAVARNVKHGEKIGAVSSCGVLVTAACSNWGCTAIAAALAARLGNAALLHTPAREEHLLRRGVDVGLINSVDNCVDANVDGIPAVTHLALVQLMETIAGRFIAQNAA